MKYIYGQPEFTGASFFLYKHLNLFFYHRVETIKKDNTYPYLQDGCKNYGKNVQMLVLFTFYIHPYNLILFYNVSS